MTAGYFISNQVINTIWRRTNSCLDGQNLLSQLRSIIAEDIRTKLERAPSSARATFQLHVDNSPVKPVGLKK